MSRLHLHLLPVMMISRPRPFSLIFAAMQSFRFLFCLPLLFFPVLPYPMFFPRHFLHRFSWRARTINVLPPVSSSNLPSPTFTVSLVLILLILSSLVTPQIHHNILISTTSILLSFIFFIGTASAPYVIVGITTVLYICLRTIAYELYAYELFPYVLWSYNRCWWC